MMSKKSKLLVYLLLLSVVDMVIPVPILGIILIYALLEKPAWFYNTVRQVYKAP